METTLVEISFGAKRLNEISIDGEELDISAIRNKPIPDPLLWWRCSH